MRVRWRALVTDPDILLLDEPLRRSTRSRAFGSTTICLICGAAA
jgi:hypothetical protein